MRIIIDTEVLKREGLYDEISDILECYGEPLDEEEEENETDIH